jgi:hypothetical protein
MKKKWTFLTLALAFMPQTRAVIQRAFRPANYVARRATRSAAASVVEISLATQPVSQTRESMDPSDAASDSEQFRAMLLARRDAPLELKPCFRPSGTPELMKEELPGTTT